MKRPRTDPAARRDPEDTSAPPAKEAPPPGARAIRAAYNVLYGLLAALFAVVAVALFGFAVYELYVGLDPRASVDLDSRLRAVLETMGLATIGVAAVELSQTVYEEEVLRDVPTSAPTRVRRFVSRFLVVVVVSLAIECLVGVFVHLHHQPERVRDTAWIGFAAAALLLAWGVFVRANAHAEALEPEAMARTKREDAKLED
ncbi:MAG: hypothetical protein WKG00_36810 [Polyangiaceae bacterium]